MEQIAMMIRPTHQPQLRHVVSAGLLLLLLAGHIARSETPDPSSAVEILRAVREGQSLREQTLEGQLRNDSDGTIIPFRVSADGSLVRYKFAGVPPTVVQVRFDETTSQLEASSNGNTDKLTPANFSTKILGTDLTYEEVAFRFIYWTEVENVGEENIKTRPAWKLLLTAPNHRTQFSTVNLWVDKENNSPLKAQAYDWSNKLISKFELISGQLFEGKWYFKQLRIESIDPNDGKVRSRTYFEIKGIAK